MDSEGSVSRLILNVRDGDEFASQQLWERYYSSLVGYANQRLPRQGRAVRDEEDAAQSAFASFYNGLANGKYPQISDRDDLWRLLIVITARKVVDLVQHERRQKRGGGRVINSAELEEVIGSEPTPEFSLEVAEQYDRLLDLLDKTSRWRKVRTSDTQRRMSYKRNSLGSSAASQSTPAQYRAPIASGAGASGTRPWLV